MTETGTGLGQEPGSGTSPGSGSSSGSGHETEGGSGKDKIDPQQGRARGSILVSGLKVSVSGLSEVERIMGGKRNK